MAIVEKQTRSGGAGLERSCADRRIDWFCSRAPTNGVELLEAWFGGRAYHTHRHDTYAIAITDTGVQSFGYRGAEANSLPGDVVVLHPDEAHDGRAGTEHGFGYRILYVEPARIGAAARLLTGRACALPFVRDPVLRSDTLADAVGAAFRNDLEPLAVDSLILRLAEGLMEADPCSRRATLPARCDRAAVERARQFLEAATDRVVRSAELERITGLTRYDLARQFRSVLGTSPHRYALMRRLTKARRALRPDRSLADIALTAGFADQAHFTRRFKAAYGITPARYTALKASGLQQPSSPERRRWPHGRGVRCPPA